MRGVLNLYLIKFFKIFLKLQMVSWSPIVSFRVGIGLSYLTLFLATSKVAVRQHDDTGRLKEEEEEEEEVKDSLMV